MKETNAEITHWQRPMGDFPRVKKASQSLPPAGSQWVMLRAEDRISPDGDEVPLYGFGNGG